MLCLHHQRNRPMIYVRTYSRFRHKLMAPDTVSDYARRFRSLTKEIEKTKQPRRRMRLKIVRSLTLMDALRFLGEVRFRELLRKIGLSRRSPRLRWHRLVAESAGKLLNDEGLPDDDAKLLRLAIRIKEKDKM